MKIVDQKEKRSIMLIGAFFTLLSMGILAVGIIAYQDFKEHHHDQVSDQLATITNLKMNELIGWRDGHLANAEIFRQNSDFAEHVQHLIENPDDRQSSEQVRSWLQSYLLHEEYESVQLLDVKGRILLSSSSDTQPVSNEIVKHIPDTLNSNQVQIMDFFNDETQKDVHIAILIPVMSPQSDRQAIGLVLVIIDPNQYIYPYLQQWPLSSESGETLLLHQTGNEVLLLSPSRFNDNKVLAIHFPLTETSVPSAQVVSDQGGVSEGVDYRGIQVIAYTDTIPNLPWLLISKIDMTEANLPLREYSLEIILTCFALISIVGAALAVVWRSQRMRYYRQQIGMAEALSESEERYHNFIMHGFEAISRMEFDHPIDISLPVETQIDLIYENAYIAECNQALADRYNISSPAEIVNIRLIELHGGKDNPIHSATLRKLIESGYKSINEETFETTADGKPAWFMSSMIGMIENGHLVRMWSTAINITKRKQAEEALVESQQLLQTIVDTAPVRIFWKDRESRYLGCNPSFAMDAGGTNPVDIIGKDDYELGRKDQADQYRADDRAVMDSGIGKISYEEPQVAPDGHLIMIRTSKVPLRDREKQVIGVLGIYEDITERKLIEKQLQEAERKYRTLVEYSPVVVYIDEVGGEWQYLSPQIEKILGYSPEYFTKNKLTFKTLIHPDDLQQFQTQLDESLERGGQIKLEYRIRSLEGNYIWISDKADVTKDPASGKYYLQGVFQDITEQKKAEETLAANERRYRALIENISDGIELVDARGIVTYASPSAARLLGYSQDTLLMPITSLIHLDDLDNAAAGFTKVFTTNETVMQSYRALHNDGSWRWLEGSATNRLDDPAIGSIIVTFRDVTERKRAEGALRESEESFHSLFEDLPIAIWLEDFSLIRAQIERLRRQGVTNFREYWSEHTDEMQQLPGLIKILEINQASAKILGTTSKEQVIKNLPNYFTNESLKVFTEEMVAIAEGRTEFRAEIPLLNLRREGVIFEFALAVQPGHENDLSRVMFSFLDITERKKADNKLKESEARFRQLAENIKEVFWMFDRRENRHVYANPAYQSIFHIDPENIHLTSLIEITHPEDRPVVIAAIEKQKLGEPTEMEYRIHWTDGSTHWIWDRSFPIFDDDGKLVRTAGVATDITENKRAEVELRESESFLQSIVRSAPGYIVSHDLEGYFLYSNHRWPDQSDAEFYNMKLRDLLHPENADAVMEAFQKAITTHDPQRVEQSVLTPGGGYHWFDVIYSPRIVDGEVRSLTAFAYDINDLKIAQNELLELNSTLEERVRRRTAEVQDLYDNAPNGYHSLDPNGALVLINQTELNWLGYTREEIFEKKTFRELLTPASQLVFDDVFPQFKSTGKISDLMVELLRKDGSVLPVLLNESAIYDEYGNFTMSRSTTTDITDRVRIENALRESRDELSSANISLEKAARLKDEFLASMSHELRTPLTGVLGLSEALQLKAYGELNDRQLKTIKSIEESGRHLLELINDILDLSKIEAGKLDLQLMSFSINDICQSSLQLIKGMAHHKKQNVHYSAPDEPIVLNADPRRIKQVLANLLSNAIKFTPENGELGLEIETVASEKKIKLTVWDKGIGIKPENMHKLFKPFTQIDSSLAREYSGTGLGLSLAQRLVELHQGVIELESVFGEGSRFTVILPWSTQEPSHEVNEQDSFAKIQAEKPDGFPTIMIADDNETVLELLTDFLESKQYHIFKSHGGAELLSKVAKIRPDLILMDIQMPGMDGLETIRRIRSNADLIIASTPIIAVTALAMPGDRERCLLAGADDYMSKPMKLNELAALIRKMKRKK